MDYGKLAYRGLNDVETRVGALERGAGSAYRSAGYEGQALSFSGGRADMPWLELSAPRPCPVDVRLDVTGQTAGAGELSASFYADGVAFASAKAACPGGGFSVPLSARLPACPSGVFRLTARLNWSGEGTPEGAGAFTAWGSGVTLSDPKLPFSACEGEGGGTLSAGGAERCSLERRDAAGNLLAASQLAGCRVVGVCRTEGDETVLARLAEGVLSLCVLDASLAPRSETEAARGVTDMAVLGAQQDGAVLVAFVKNGAIWVRRGYVAAEEGSALTLEPAERVGAGLPRVNRVRFAAGSESFPVLLAETGAGCFALKTTAGFPAPEAHALRFRLRLEETP